MKFNNTAVINSSATAPSFKFTNCPNQLHKGDTTSEGWNFEVKYLQNVHFLLDHLILQSMRIFLKGEARSMRVSLEENAKIEDILERLNGFSAMFVHLKHYFSYSIMISERE